MVIGSRNTAGGLPRGVAAAVDREPAELLLRRAVEMHVAPAVHGEPVRGRVRVVREQRRHVAHDAAQRRRGFARRPLRARRGRGVRIRGRGRCDRSADHLHRAVHEHVSRPARRDREARGHHRREQTAGVEPAAGVTGFDAERGGRGGERGVAHRRDAVDVARAAIPRRRSRRSRRSDRQIERRDTGAPADPRDADARHHGSLLRDVDHRALVPPPVDVRSTVPPRGATHDRGERTADPARDHRPEPRVLDRRRARRAADPAMRGLRALGAPAERALPGMRRRVASRAGQRERHRVHLHGELPAVPSRRAAAVRHRDRGARRAGRSPPSDQHRALRRRRAVRAGCRCGCCSSRTATCSCRSSSPRRCRSPRRSKYPLFAVVGR